MIRVVLPSHLRTLARVDVELHLAADVRERSQVGRQHDPDGHGSVWASTDTTDGRSRTTAVQLSPALADA